MKPIDVIILILAALLAVGLFAFAVIRKKRGKSSCPFCDGGGCGGNCSACSALPKQNDRSVARTAQENQETPKDNEINPQQTDEAEEN